MSNSKAEAGYISCRQEPIRLPMFNYVKKINESTSWPADSVTKMYG